MEKNYSSLNFFLYLFFCFVGAPWDEIVNALLSNTEERSKTVTLVFERELPDDDEEVEAAEEAK